MHEPRTREAARSIRRPAHAGRTVTWIVAAALIGLTSRGAATAGEFPKFRPQTIDSHVGNVCYAVTLADVDGDQRQDIVAVSENRVVWYRNPDWMPREILADQVERDHVCIAAHDVDGDGRIDFALGAGWLNNRHLGTAYWLSRGEDVNAHWRVHPLGQESWLHRIRWGDFLRLGRPQLIASPLNKTVGDGVRLLAFEIPGEPAKSTWPVHVLDEHLNSVHNHWVVDLDRDGQDDLLTASQEGIHLFQHQPDGKLRKQRLAVGAADEKNPAARGAGEIKVGRLRDGTPFIATVEPMHGTQAVVYTPPGPEGGEWHRHVLDDTLKRGHAVWCADVDRDGSDELIVGHSDPGPGPIVGPGIYIYDWDGLDFAKARKHVIDQGDMATEDIAAADLNQDGWIDIVAGGRATHNVKLYLNAGSGTE